MILQRDIAVGLIGLVIGSLISWLISDAYYEKSVNASKDAAKETMRMNNFLLKGIESIGTIKYIYDPSGIPTGIVIKLKGSAKSSSNATGELTINSLSNSK